MKVTFVEAFVADLGAKCGVLHCLPQFHHHDARRRRRHA